MEVLIVAALLGILAGIAIFGVQAMYDENRRKAVFDETSQIGRGLSFAHQALGFHPRIYLLGLPVTEIITPQTPGVPSGLDTYGQIPVGSAAVANITRKWTAPYMGFSEGRKVMSQGSRGIKRVYIPEIGQNVEWPTDTWGNPYMLYEVVSYFEGSSPMLRFANPGENGTFLTAVVSFGKNGVPGAHDERQGDSGYSDSVFSDIVSMRRNSMPFFISDENNPTQHATDWENMGGRINPPQFTLRPFAGGGSVSNNSAEILGRLTRDYAPHLGISYMNGYNGMLDDGTDDIIWRF